MEVPHNNYKNILWTLEHKVLGKQWKPNMDDPLQGSF